MMTVARKGPPCIESRTCTGGLWGLDRTEQICQMAEHFTMRFLEHRDPDGDGFLRRLTLYENGHHARLLARLAEDWHIERLGELRQRGPLSSDPRARLPHACSDHYRHGVRVDALGDRATRTIGLSPTLVQPRDLLKVGEITAAACWVPEATTLLLLARSRGWLPPRQRDVVVAAIQRLPPELRWPTYSSLFRHRKVTRPEILARAAHRFGIDAEIQTDRDVQIVQRTISTRLRSVRKDPSRRKVQRILREISGIPPSRRR